MQSDDSSCPLARGKCVPCRGGVEPLTLEEIEPLKSQLHADWRVIDGHHLERAFRFKNFASALEFTNNVGAIAEEQQHHPDIQLGWGKVVVTLYTHKIGGLHENDFILAAKIDEIVQ